MTTAPVLSAPRPPADPLLANQAYPHRRTFFPLGFRLEIQTNSAAILAAAEQSWGEQPSLPAPPQLTGTLRLTLGVTSSSAHTCPPATLVRAHDHLLSIVADAENFAVCDLERGTAFGWVTEAVLQHRAYLRYHFLEAVAMCLLVGARVTPIHAGCISLHGKGVLLCGESGAGKSTLAYACARAGFTFTTDDASYIVWHTHQAQIRGNAHQVRFRPSARQLFPELAGRALTPRTEGKPSMEVRTAELPIRTATQASIHAVLFLNRHQAVTTEILPLWPGELFPYLEASLLPLRQTRERQAVSLQVFRDVPAFSFHYRDLEPAIAHLTAFLHSLPAHDK